MGSYAYYNADGMERLGDEREGEAILCVPIGAAGGSTSTPASAVNKLGLSQRETTPPQTLAGERGRRPRMCAFVRMPGGCRNGEDCGFCHTREELEAHPRFKTRPCLTFYSKGRCPAVDECGYYHSEAERRAPPEDEVASGYHRPVIPQMCHYASLLGGCNKGDSCKFCHSEEQMARIYKTRPCDSFWLHGECDRGVDCGFYHTEEERRPTDEPSTLSAPPTKAEDIPSKKESAPKGFSKQTKTANGDRVLDQLRSKMQSLKASPAVEDEVDREECRSPSPTSTLDPSESKVSESKPREPHSKAAASKPKILLDAELSAPVPRVRHRLATVDTNDLCRFIIGNPAEALTDSSVVEATLPTVDAPSPELTEAKPSTLPPRVRRTSAPDVFFGGGFSLFSTGQPVDQPLPEDEPAHSEYSNNFNYQLF